MAFKTLILWLTIFGIFGAALGLSLEHIQAQNQPEEMNVDMEDPAGDLDWLRQLGVEHRFKRRRFDKSDPRSLFAAIYSNYPYAKRFSGAVDNYYYPMEPAALTREPLGVGIKRGLKSPLDPRNLFRAVYGYRK